MSQIVLRTISTTSNWASVVSSPEMTAMPVLTSVSQATREFGSCSRQASRIASEIWSAILSGWPSVTDSEVKRCSTSASFSDWVISADLLGSHVKGSGYESKFVSQKRGGDRLF